MGASGEAWIVERRGTASGALEHELRRAGAPVAYAEVLERWAAGDATLAAALGGTLAAAPFEAYLWETPPVARDTVGRPFTFVLVESRSLARRHPEPEVFARHYGEATDGVATFPNLGGDAVLVAPLPEAAASYAHLAAFARAAASGLQTALWRAVGAAALAELDAAPLWISTNGLGVAWLHVRLDAAPKYYHHGPYREGS